MNEPKNTQGAAEKPPRSKTKEKTWNFSAVWVVPVVAAIVAGYLVYNRVHEYGPKITIRFKDAGGLKIDQTPVRYRGVQIGEVTAVDLSEDRQHALVTVRLRRSGVSVAG